MTPVDSARPAALSSYSRARPGSGPLEVERLMDLPTTVLGRTGLRVTRLGIGGGYCQTADGYRAALDCGVTYVDTAHNYRDGEDEKTIGQAIKGRRDDLVLASKSQLRDAAGARADLETSLRSLGVDYLDIWQLHYVNTPTDREQALGPGGAYEAALRAREQGLVRFIGVTGHDWDQVGANLAGGLFDTVLCWYNCAMPEPETQLFPHTLAQNMGVALMRTTSVDKLYSPDNDPREEDFYRYVWGNPAVNVALMGLRDVERFRRVSTALRDYTPMSEEERRRMEVYGKALRDEGKIELP